MSFANLADVFAGPVMLILTAALKGALLVGLAFIATHLLRHRSAATRHTIWAAAVLGHLVLLVALPLVPRLDVPLVPAVTWGPAAEVPQSFKVETATEPVPLPSAEASAPAAGNAVVNATITPVEPARTFPSLLSIVIATWLLGAAVVFARYVVGTIRVARLARASERVADGNWLSLVHRMAINMGIARPLTLVRGGQLDVPVTWGILYPVVFLPADSDTWDAERQRFVLVHELAHVKRLDAVTQLLTQITVALFWFDPLVWYAAGRIRTERERACDDQVILQGVRPSLYADELLEMVRGIAPRGNDPAPAFAALAMARRSEFEGRMLAILDPRAPRESLSRSARLATLAAAFLLVAPLAAFRPVARSADAADEGQRAQLTDGSAAHQPTAISPANSAPAPERAPGSSAATAPASSPTTATTVSQPAAPNPRYQCRASDMSYTGEETIVHSHTGDDAANSYTGVIRRSPRYCASALLQGDVSLSSDLTHVAGVAPGARAAFHEITPGLTRELLVTRAADGSLAHRYLENGNPADASSANRWLAELLRGLVLKAGFGVSRRVPQLRAKSGVAAVLREASQAPSSGVKRAYLEALLRSQPRLSQDESDQVLRLAAAQITSSGDLRHVVETAVRHARPSPGALEAAVARISSDGDRRSVLSKSLLRHTADGSLLSSNVQLDPATVQLVLRSVMTIDSDGDKTAVLIDAAPHAFRTAALRSQFYAAATTVDSDGDKRRVLMAALRHTPKDLAAVRDFLGVASQLSSDGDKSAVLVAAIGAGLVSSDAARQAFLETLRGIESDGDKTRVTTALLR